MQIIKPITIDNDALESSNVTEDDHSEWASGTTYANGDRVIAIGTTHKVYESVQGSNSGNDPTTDDGTWWLELGATNRWKAFDQKLSDQVENADSITYSIRVPAGALVSGIAAFNVEADTVQVQVEDDTSYYSPDTDGVRLIITLNDAPGPYLETLADRFSATTDDDTHYKAFEKAFLQFGEYTISTHVRADPTPRYVRLTLPSAAFGTFHVATFDLFGGSVESVTAGATASIEPLDDAGEWFRVSMTATATATATASARVQLEEATGPVFIGQGDPEVGILVYGTSVELNGNTGGLVYDKTNSAVASTQVDDWYSYFYGAFDQASETLFLDQPSFQELPGYGGYRIAIAITRAGGTAKLGQIVLGRLLSIGRTIAGTNVGAQDFSVKGTDDFGNAILTQRGFSREVDYEVVYPTGGTQRVAKILDDVRARPVVWLAGPDTSQLGTTAYGWWDDYSLRLDGKNSLATISVKGLV